MLGPGLPTEPLRGSMHVRSLNRLLLAVALCAPLATSVFVRKQARKAGRREAQLLTRASKNPDSLELPRFPRGSPEEKRIFEKHWWPLAPPPGHRPGQAFLNPEEFAAVSALVENYTQYWRSLPMYPKVSPLLHQAERQPYFKFDWRTVESLSPSATGQDPRLEMQGLGPAKVLFMAHHKMGVELLAHIQQTLSKVLPKYATSYEMFPAWCPPPGTKLIHMVRNPVDAILSGFRYHQRQWAEEIADWGHNHMQDPQCFECSEEDHAAMFDTCSFNCTYFELLNRVDDLTGATIEALSQRKPLASMGNALARCGKREDVLHLSVDLFKADYPKATSCLLRFLGLGEGGQLQEALLRGVQEVDHEEHQTTGKYDNANPRAYLRGHPAWGSDFAEADKLLKEAFRRQAHLYDCPEPELREA